MTRREYHRLYARRRRAAKLEAARHRARTCPHRHGAGFCGAVLETVTDGNGALRRVCRPCERRLAGICRDCPAPVVGRVGSALRCEKHKAQAHDAQIRRYAERHREEVNASARRYARRASVRRRRNEYKRLWRKLNRDKVRAQKRRAALRGWGKEYQAKRREREREQLAARECARQRGITERRTCLTCPTVVRGRTKKCTLCKEGERLTALDALRAA